MSAFVRSGLITALVALVFTLYMYALVTFGPVVFFITMTALLFAYVWMVVYALVAE